MLRTWCFPLHLRKIGKVKNVSEGLRSRCPMELPSSLSFWFSFRIAGNHSNWVSLVGHEMFDDVRPHRRQSMMTLRCRHELDPIGGHWRMNSHIYMIWLRPPRGFRISDNFSQSPDSAPSYLNKTAHMHKQLDFVFLFLFSQLQSIVYHKYYDSFCLTLGTSVTFTLFVSLAISHIVRLNDASASRWWVSKVNASTACWHGYVPYRNRSVGQVFSSSPPRWKPTNTFSRMLLAKLSTPISRLDSTVRIYFVVTM